MDILILILVAIVITATTTKVKQFADYTVSIFTKKKVKLALPISLILGILAGVTLNIGLVQSVLQIAGNQTAFSETFKMVDIGFSCIALSAGSGYIIKIVEKNKKAMEELAKNVEAK